MIEAPRIADKIERLWTLNDRTVNLQSGVVTFTEGDVVTIRTRNNLIAMAEITRVERLNQLSQVPQPKPL
jgi:hypothetical protein